MSLIASFTKRSKLNSTIKQTEQARNSEGGTADNLFKGAYQGYAEVLLDDPLRADALYNWGFALLHQAKTKTGDEAVEIYQDAINKFAFCLLINPNYLAAAINGGVAYMDLARLTEAKPDDKVYDLAKKQFEKANAIQSGTASYNLACIYALRNDQDACLNALENAKDKGSLPVLAEDIINDPDLKNVQNKDWFNAFIESLTKPSESAVEGKTVSGPEQATVEAEAESEQASTEERGEA